MEKSFSLPSESLAMLGPGAPLALSPGPGTPSWHTARAVCLVSVLLLRAC